MLWNLEGCQTNGQHKHVNCMGQYTEIQNMLMEWYMPLEKIWTERGLMNSRGKDLMHEELIQQVLEALLLPEEIGIVHMNGHQTGNIFEAVSYTHLTLPTKA